MWLMNYLTTSFSDKLVGHGGTNAWNQMKSARTAVWNFDLYKCVCDQFERGEVNAKYFMFLFWTVCAVQRGRRWVPEKRYIPYSLIILSESTYIWNIWDEEQALLQQILEVNLDRTWQNSGLQPPHKPMRWPVERWHTRTRSAYRYWRLRRNRTRRKKCSRFHLWSQCPAVDASPRCYLAEEQLQQLQQQLPWGDFADQKAQHQLQVLVARASP